MQLYKFSTSVVIPAYNGLEHLKRNLPHVLKLGADQVIVVDDASTDGTSSYLQSNFPQVTLVIHPKNIRFTKSVNDGFSHATGDIVILLNQDVTPQIDLIKKTLPHFEDPLLFAVTFAEVDRSWADGLWERGFLEFKNGIRDGQVHDSLWASGGSAAFRKTYWDQLKGFDPIFTPGYFEDVDLGLRAHKAGYKIIWDPKCKVDHLTETAFKKAFEPTYLARVKDRNYLLAMWKNLPAGQLGSHLSTLIKRIISHPGFIIPTLWAIWKRLV